MGYDYSPELRRRIAARLCRVKRLAVHLAITLVVALGLTFGIEGGQVPRQLEGIIPVVILSFVAHALWLMYREACWFITQQEIRHEPLDEYNEKPKHKNEEIDGELVDFVGAGDELLEQSHRRR